MKHFLIFLIFSSISMFSIAQKADVFSNGFSIEAGYLIISDHLNEDSYLSDKLAGQFLFDNGDGFSLNGMSLKITKNTKVEFLDIVCGALIIRDRNTTISNLSDENQNGGGVYFGISPKYKTKHFGLTSDFAVGVLSFKKYMHAYYQIPNGGNLIDEHETKTSQGLGAISSVGFYVSAGRFSLNPSFMLIFSGGANASFTYYGFNIPLVFKF